MIRINLLPVREARRKAGVRQQLVLLAATVAGAVLISGGVHSWTRGQIGDARQRAKALETQLLQFKPQEEQVANFKAKKADIEQKLAVIERLERSRSGPVHIMDELASHIPDRVWITTMVANNGQIELEGLSLDNELVALFLTALNDSAYFANVELETTELREVEELKLNTFKIRAQLESPEEPAPPTPAPAVAQPGKGGRAAPARTPARAPARKS